MKTFDEWFDEFRYAPGFTLWDLAKAAWDARQAEVDKWRENATVWRQYSERLEAECDRVAAILGKTRGGASEC